MAQYRALFGWTIDPDDGWALLRLGNGMIGVVVPASTGPMVAAVLRRDDAECPVLAVTRESPSWLFLVDADGYVPTGDELPDGVSLLGYATRVPIPAADARFGQARWAIPPDQHRRWLPTLAAVMCAIRRTTPEPVTPPAPSPDATASEHPVSSDRARLGILGALAFGATRRAS